MRLLAPVSATWSQTLADSLNLHIIGSAGTCETQLVLWSKGCVWLKPRTGEWTPLESKMSSKCHLSGKIVWACLKWQHGLILAWILSGLVDLCCDAECRSHDLACTYCWLHMMCSCGLSAPMLSGNLVSQLKGVFVDGFVCSRCLQNIRKIVLWDAAWVGCVRFAEQVWSGCYWFSHKKTNASIVPQVTTVIMLKRHLSGPWRVCSRDLMIIVTGCKFVYFCYVSFFVRVLPDRHTCLGIKTRISGFDKINLFHGEDLLSW